MSIFVTRLQRRKEQKISPLTPKVGSGLARGAATERATKPDKIAEYFILNAGFGV